MLKGRDQKFWTNQLGGLIKKVPCGFYPACAKALDADDTVIGGKIVLPVEHRRWDKQVFVCLDHKEDSTSGVTEEVDSSMVDQMEDESTPTKDETKKDEDTEGSSMDELETSILEDDKKEGLGLKSNEDTEKDEGEDERLDSAFLSQSLLKRN